MAPTSLAATIAAALEARGVPRLFGIPGGGSSLDLIDAADRAGIPFVLTGTETGAAMMAAVTAELSGTPGAVLTGVGPGAAAAVNGIAYAALEKAPVVLFTDCQDDPDALHQAFDQPALYRPVTKASRRLRPAEGRAGIEALLDLALAPPRGPVQVDLSSADAMAPAAETPSPPAEAPVPAPGPDAIEAARALLAGSRRPVILVGLEARSAGAAKALAGLQDALGAAVMPSYKAKGVFPESAPASIAPFTGAAADGLCLGAADLIVLYGVDPVEFIPAPWPHRAPLLEMSLAAGHRQPVQPAVSLIGPLEEAVAALRAITGGDGWPADELAALRTTLRQRLTLQGDGRTAEAIIRALAAVAPAGTRLTVDAGAHMFSTLALWQADQPFGVLKSNGLSSMGFALPAAIASALCEPQRPVAAVTGDGGLLMCLGELATAARTGATMAIVVVNDGALSLIDIKQQRQQRPPRGVRTAPGDFAAAARALGCRGLGVGPGDDLSDALNEAFAGPGPAVVDVRADPAGYGDQLTALRG